MLTVEVALRAYASMINNLDSSKLEPYLAVDFHYASQMVLPEIKSKQAFLDYINPKLENIRISGARAWAEMATLTHNFPSPCVVIAQDHKENLIAVVLAKVREEYIERIDMCIVPTPQSAIRTGDYPY